MIAKQFRYFAISLFRHLSCLPDRIRTWDPLIKSQLLYQLSYGEESGCKSTNFYRISSALEIILSLWKEGIRQQAIGNRDLRHKFQNIHD